MEYVIETYIPHTRVAVTRPELPGAYEKLREAVSATVTWRAGLDTALLVAVGDDYCYVNLQHDDTFYVLAVPTSGEDDHDEILLIGGVDTSVAARTSPNASSASKSFRKPRTFPGCSPNTRGKSSRPAPRSDPHSPGVAETGLARLRPDARRGN